MNSISQIFKLVKNGSRLEDVIPIGASLPHWEALLNNYKPDAKPRKPSTRKASGKTTKRSQKAAMENVTALATLTLVERVNGETQATDPNTDRAGRQQQIKDLLAEIDADVRARLARRNEVYDAMIRPDPLNCEPQRGGWMVKE